MGDSYFSLSKIVHYLQTRRKNLFVEITVHYIYVKACLGNDQPDSNFVISISQEAISDDDGMTEETVRQVGTVIDTSLAFQRKKFEEIQKEILTSKGMNAISNELATNFEIANQPTLNAHFTKAGNTGFEEIGLDDFMQMISELGAISDGSSSITEQIQNLLKDKIVFDLNEISPIKCQPIENNSDPTTVYGEAWGSW